MLENLPFFFGSIRFKPTRDCVEATGASLALWPVGGADALLSSCLHLAEDRPFRFRTDPGLCCTTADSKKAPLD